MNTVAILGAGIGAAHFDAYQKLPDRFKVLWIVDKDTTKAAALAGTGGAQTSPAIEHALSDPSVDLIDICLPPHLHASVTCAALKAGKHVICEKPLATSLKDVAEISDTAARCKRSVFPVFQYRWGPAFSQLQGLVDAGLTGRPVMAAAETHWARGPDYYAVPWRGTWAGEQGGAVLGHAIHSHDLLTMFMGPVKSVSAMVATRVNEIETEDCAAIAFEFENGSLATSSVTLGGARDETRLRFVFEKLTATSATNPYAPGDGIWEFRARNPMDQQAVDDSVARAATGHSGFAGFLEEVHKSLNGLPNGAVTLEQGEASIALVTAIYDAARTGARVTLPISSDHALFGGWTP